MNNALILNEDYLEFHAKPVLKWAGGKGMLLPQITEYLPTKLKFGAIKRYIEPFVGGGAALNWQITIILKTLICLMLIRNWLSFIMLSKITLKN